jgi:BirA family biotin operon repressor/biotin-[acetyl-CoA-carboxylase] ligase
MDTVFAFDPGRFELIARARELPLGQPLIFHASTTSTNDIAMRLCQEGAPHGLLVVADYQTQGRGRRGNLWHSPREGENLLFSLIMRLQHESDLPSNFTLAIGLALRDAVQPLLDQTVRIKWPNDILVDSKKLAGILVECELQQNKLPAFVIGIGLNVSMRALPAPIEPVATSLSLLQARSVDKETILADILQSIDKRVRHWQSHGFESMASELRQCDALLGRQITVDGVRGRSLGIDDSGALILRADDETVPRRLLNGTVEIID